MVRTTVRLPKKTVAWAKRQAKKYGMGAGRFIGLLLKEHLEQGVEKPAATARWPLWPREHARRSPEMKNLGPR
jgi:hypothetical protein